MLSFFRKIRKQLAADNKPLKYLRYAIGEILLVVIGILLALQINTWNENRKSNMREMKLLTELKTNLHINVQNLEKDIESQTQSAKVIDKLLDHLDHKRPYTDSLAYYFSMADYAPDVVLSSSAFETLKSSGLELISTDTLRSTIINLFEIYYPTLMQETKRLEDQLWPTAAVPMYQKHFRREQKDFYTVNDYQALLDDKEFTNMLSFRGNLRKQSTIRKIKAKDQTLNVLAMIHKELSND